MDFVEGEDLQEMLNRSGPLQEARAIHWISQICDALTYLHSQTPPVIHRDIKPANIKITPDEKSMLVDFGIAKVYDPGSATTQGARAITPGYSPPEQYGLGSTDARSDVYAIGATLYTLLTGKIPIESVHVSINNPQISPRTLTPQVSAQVENCILRAMDIHPQQRYQDTADLRNALSMQSVQPPAFVYPPVQHAIEPTEINPKQSAQPFTSSPGIPWKIILIGAATLLFIILAGFGGIYIGTIIVDNTDTPTPTVGTHEEITPTNTILEVTTALTPGGDLPPDQSIFIPTLIASVTQDAEEITVEPPTNTPTETATTTLTFTPSHTSTPTQTPTPSHSPTPTRPFPPLLEGINGNDLAFSSNRTGYFQIWLLDSDDTHSGLVLPLPSGHERAWWPTFCQSRVAAEIGHAVDSEEGQWIYWLFPGDGTTEIISSLPGSDGAYSVGVPRCSHDGRYLGYNARKGSWQLIIADMSNNYVAASFDPQPGHYDGYVSWNIWNDEIVYTDQIVTDKDYDIMKAGFSTSSQDITPTRMSSGESILRAMYPALSPDGTKIVFTCFGTERVYRLCLSDIGSDYATVIHQEIGPKEEYPVGSPVWSSDGEWIYFSAKDGGDWDIFCIKPSGDGL